ncbi:hypothetical protein D920_00386 [Enterococcus faecalis 13-SD-W-01]|nr:hypothetical protein D920_00386 [Enterococcus faecalis 13-SD-W-01]
MLLSTTIPTAVYASEVNNVESKSQVVSKINNNDELDFVTDKQSSEFQGLLQDSLTSYKAKSQAEQQEAIKQVADQLQWLFTNGVVRNSFGDITAIDYNKIEEHYGDVAINSAGYQILKEVVAQFDESTTIPSNMPMPRSFASCMEDNIKDLVGGTVFAAISKGAWAKLIEEAAWEEVAELIVEVAGSEFTVPVLLTSLVYFAGKCI